ncbi:killer cell lectin-like receptor subfamily B member 1B allele C [Emydura macquarii macquarii]|uniref:killer cell lectin-like receptor subfamily B member 1B allele C n=1 Tax=Emydura macquarii macquarii TaxID=1129001 RepID=UPI00352A385F
MADGAIYTFLNMPADPLPSNISTPAQHHTCPQCPPWHRIALSVGWASTIILLGAVIALAVLVYRSPSQDPPLAAAVTKPAEKRNSCGIHQNTTACNDCTLEDFRSYLKLNLCEVENSSAEGTGCRLCPRLWLPHRDKCYWLSKEAKFWTRAQEDCARRRSQLLVIQDSEEMEFIQNITKNQNHMWIGLNITSRGRNWTWVDGSPLNQTLFMVSGPVEKNSCASLQKNQIHSEICNTDYKWICQKKAVII